MCAKRGMKLLDGGGGKPMMDVLISFIQGPRVQDDRASGDVISYGLYRDVRIKVRI